MLESSKAAGRPVEARWHGISKWRIEAAVLARSVWLWFLARLMLAPLLMAARVDPIIMDARASLILALVIGTISWLDTRGQNEDLLLATLGTSRWVIHALGFGAPLAFESFLAIVGRL